eukprot:TRINITY_DN6451_c0_g1_i4.p1 TRINITY_DN6451_c0_g1~~TRINITY_DN6451_c0_g1_i4.p1  ORF type:complete len:234 (+),score=41.78 TRINITY_DN6451_c0_g1_i4:173-874(+)
MITPQPHPQVAPAFTPLPPQSSQVLITSIFDFRFHQTNPRHLLSQEQERARKIQRIKHQLLSAGRPERNTMWRRVSSQLQTLAPSWRSTALNIPRSNGARLIRNPSFLASPSFPFSTSVSDTSVGTKKVEDIMPIATGHEREELEAELQGQKRFDLDAPVGPFGTKESPAIVKSYYDKRIVGCPGGEGEDEHDVVWFWLEKDKPFECSVCSQYFKLEVIGEGGPPDGHGDDHH